MTSSQLVRWLLQTGQIYFLKACFPWVDFSVVCRCALSIVRPQGGQQLEAHLGDCRVTWPGVPSSKTAAALSNPTPECRTRRVRTSFTFLPRPTVYLMNMTLTQGWRQYFKLPLTAVCWPRAQTACCCPGSGSGEISPEAEVSSPCCGALASRRRPTEGALSALQTCSAGPVDGVSVWRSVHSLRWEQMQSASLLSLCVALRPR